MYKIESIRKAMNTAKEIGNKYQNMDIEEIKICISGGNRKIGKVINVSLMPIVTCANCKECKYLCYDIKACLQYPNTVIDARMRNTVLVKRDMTRYFDTIESKISRRKKNKYFRWHVAGDIINMEYFQNMVRIAKNHPDFTFWTYTKNYSLVNEYCMTYGKESVPKNFSIMFSEWDGMPLINPFGFPVFSCKLKNGNKNRTEDEFSKMYKCPGNCDICKKGKGHGCIIGQNTYADEH